MLGVLAARIFPAMPQAYSPASLDLGLGDGNLLSQQVDTDEDELKKKKKLMAQGLDQTGSNSFGLGAAQMLGLFRA